MVQGSDAEYVLSACPQNNGNFNVGCWQGTQFGASALCLGFKILGLMFRVQGLMVTV